MKAWYFATSDRKLRYGDDRPIVVGETHTVDCKPILCEQGLHGSVNILDALSYSPGPILYLVDIEGDIDIGGDKICGKSRTYLAGFDATGMLFEASRLFALETIHLIKPYTDKYDLIVEYLNTGNLDLRDAARAAARAAARDAARAAAWAAARDADRAADAARAAAWAAAAAADAARAAAWDVAAAADAARAAAWDAAMDADAARAAAWDVAMDADAARAAAWDAAMDAAKKRQARILISLVHKYCPSIEEFSIVK